MQLESTLIEFPDWAIVQIAARCARRVEPLYRAAWPEAPENMCVALTRSIVAAENPEQFSDEIGSTVAIDSHRAVTAARRAGNQLAVFAAAAAANSVSAGLCWLSAMSPLENAVSSI